MSQIGVSYTPSGGSPVYSFVFDNFGDNALPRSYQGGADFSQSANGTSIISGPAFRQKYIWVISSIITKTEAASFDEMFQAWDTDRAAGLPAALGITDNTFGPSLSASAVISTSPSYTRLGPQFMLVSFALAEV
jgi:hypothetical protein